MQPVFFDNIAYFYTYFRSITDKSDCCREQSVPFWKNHTCDATVILQAPIEDFIMHDWEL
ncbi:hypothetical protein H6G69_31040 [Nostoc sp. FACHB-110]|nr:hypothetical protein [Nostoc sp. FACHB-110]